MHLFDSHCHLDVSPIHGQLSQVLDRARKVGVEEIVVPGVDHEGWERILAISGQENGIHAAPGLHPMYLELHRPEHLEILAALAASGRIVAIGEIGLDYFVPGLDRSEQQLLFEAQLVIASRAHLPVLLHARKAHDQVLATLRRSRFPHGGIVHAFSGSYQQAVEYIKLGFGIGVGGTISYDRATKIRKNCSELPRDWLVLETDAPDIIVADHRDETCNLPEYLPEICRTLAALRSENPQTTAATTSENARRILGLG